MLYIALSLFVNLAIAQTFEQIKSIDLADDKPAAQNYILVEFKMKGPTMMSRVVLHQFSKRVRLDYEGSGLSKGTYTLATAGACVRTPTITAGVYRSGWSELHRFVIDSTHTALEKSLPKASLRGGGGSGKTILEGKGLALYHLRGDKLELVDCQVIH